MTYDTRAVDSQFVPVNFTFRGQDDADEKKCYTLDITINGKAYKDPKISNWLSKEASRHIQIDRSRYEDKNGSMTLTADMSCKNRPDITAELIIPRPIHVPAPTVAPPRLVPEIGHVLAAHAHCNNPVDYSDANHKGAGVQYHVSDYIDSNGATFGFFNSVIVADPPESKTGDTSANTKILTGVADNGKTAWGTAICGTNQNNADGEVSGGIRANLVTISW